MMLVLRHYCMELTISCNQTSQESGMHPLLEALKSCTVAKDFPITLKTSKLFSNLQLMDLQQLDQLYLVSNNLQAF